MKLTDFLRKTNVDHSLLIGYYGGGNYGDELLLEVLCNLLKRRGAEDITITYQQPETYPTMHHDFGFRLVDMRQRRAVLAAALKCKNIIVGGGGLWGVDMNFNTLLMSLFLFVSRWALRKRVYLLGVGYYTSTPWAGRLAAWLAGKAASVVIARDNESLQNFAKLGSYVQQDSDIAWQIPTLDLSPYQDEATALQTRVPISSKTLLVAYRRPQAGRQRHDFVRYNKLITWLAAANPTRPIIIVMMEAEAKDASVHAEARALQRHHQNVRLIETPYNPLALFAFVLQNHKRLAVIAPQLHLIMTAHLAGIPFLPITYDNKVTMLLDQLHIPAGRRRPLTDLAGDDLQTFADKFFGGAGA